MRTKAQLTIAEDLSVGDWIRNGLEPWSSFPLPLGTCIPIGFQSYVLIRYKRPEDSSGEIGTKTLRTLLNILAEFATTPKDCFHALWDGFGWLNQGAVSFFMPRKTSRISWIANIKPFRFLTMRVFWRMHRQSKFWERNHIANSLPEGIMEHPRLRLPNRDYLLMRGSIQEALHTGYEVGESFFFQSPNLIWPSDKSWIFVKEIDFPAILIGGSQELVQRILLDSGLTSEVFHRTDTTADLGLIET
jgi:hypothetical protein